MSKYKDHTRISTFSNIIVNLILIILSAVCILPIILVLSVSLTDEKTLNLSGYNIIPLKFSTYGYQYILKLGQQLVHAYGITIFITVIGTVTSMLIISMYAYVLSRKDFKYRNLFSFILFFTMLFSGGLVPTYLVVVNLLHLKNSLAALILPYLINAWWVLILRSFISTNVPAGIIESAKIDGAGEFRIFFKIVLPLTLPGLATIGLFCSLQYWNDWYLPMLYIDDSDLVSLPYLLYKTMVSMQYLLQNSSSMAGGRASDILSNMPSESARMAMAILGVGPIILAFPFFQKYLIKGLTVGAIKG